MTTRLRQVVFVAICLFVVHGMEEWVTGFYFADPTFAWISRFARSEPEAVFLGFQLSLWIWLILFFVMLLGPQWRMRALLVFGMIMTAELEHLAFALVRRSYYPGSVTSLLFLPLSVVFWIEYRRVRGMVASDGTISTDPVCGMRVHRAGALTLSIGGRDFVFCSESCRTEFIATGRARSDGAP
ncbi:MAG: HXXEE domain-containing protein [Planctomycetota bacterium]